MPHVRAWFSRLLGLFQKNKRDAEMAEEIQAHVDLLAERNIASITAIFRIDPSNGTGISAPSRMLCENKSPWTVY